MLSLLILLFLFGAFVLVFSGSPFYSVFGVLSATLAHSIFFAYLGGSFFSLLFIIIYAGGMLVVFLFSTILSADRYPWFPLSFFFFFLLRSFLLILPLFIIPFCNLVKSSFLKNSINEVLIKLYTPWGLILSFTGVVLLFGLMAVLIFGFEHGFKRLRRL